MTPWRKLAAESIGTAFLLAMVVGSGIMGERLAGGNEAITPDLERVCGDHRTARHCVALRFRHESTPHAVAAYITAAYWFTASTSFANPAVTLGRSITNTFTGVAPMYVVGFIAAQVAAALIASWFVRGTRSEIRSNG